MKISQLKTNEKNPRFIKDDKFKKLVNSIKEFPKMMELRPIVVDENNTVLGGNMRLKALQELNYKDIPDNWVKKASDLTEEQKNEFIIKDNVGFGDWDFEILGNEFEAELLEDWGLVAVNFQNELDYSILDGDTEIDAKIEDFQNDVKKALQIPFDLQDYDEAQELYKFWRDKGAYVGGLFIEKLRTEKNKL